jgi:DNA-binding transcriptional regulator LsrR (DeoR family)
MSRINSLRLMTRVAQMYYLENLSQSEISQQTHISQATISRLLKKAHTEGIVKFAINVPRGIYPEIENELRTRYGIPEVIVTECGADHEDSILSSIGEAAAHYLENTLGQGEVIGISSWSASLLRMVDKLHPVKRVVAGRVVQLMGGIGNPAVQVHATHLTTRLAQLTGASPQLLPSPTVASSAGARDVLRSDPNVKAALELGRHVTLALIGVGAVEPSYMLANSGNVFTSDELHDVASKGAVGDVCLRFFDREGNPVRTELDSRVIGISLDDLKRVPRVICVAGGARKIEALRGALLGRFMNVLITDRFTATKLLAIS